MAHLVDLDQGLDRLGVAHKPAHHKSEQGEHTCMYVLWYVC
jgi:hypothetical protein